MIFTTKAEVIAYYHGRLVKADRWAFWKDGVKWCGTPTEDNRNEIRSLQDVKDELSRQRDMVIDSNSHILQNNLFQLGKFKLASGLIAPYKIECDAFTDDDWECLAHLLSQKLPCFGKVYGVPTGGYKLQCKLEKYCNLDCSTILLVDDVYTTGGSINKLKETIPGEEIIGAVVFARTHVENWITPLFSMS